MKKIIIITLAIICNVICKSQSVTRVTQLKDAKPGKAYYESLQFMVETMGAVSGDLDMNFRPEKPVTKGYWAIVTNATFDKLNEIIASSQDKVKDLAKQSTFGIEMLQAMPTNFSNIKDVYISSTNQIKDIDAKGDYYLALQSLVERYGLVWLKTPTTFAPDAFIEEEEFQKFFLSAFRGNFAAQQKRFLSRSNFIIFTAAWVKKFLTLMENKIKDENNKK